MPAVAFLVLFVFFVLFCFCGEREKERVCLSSSMCEWVDRVDSGEGSEGEGEEVPNSTQGLTSQL